MSLYLNTRGNTVLSVALCARCSRKFPSKELSPDPNYPGLMVCKADLDLYDPYRLPAPQTERINLDFVRPDVPLEILIRVSRMRITEDFFSRLLEDGETRILE
jgi:hypothetical protein